MFEGKSCTIGYILGIQIFIVSIFGGVRNFSFFLFETVLYFLMYST